MSKGLWFATGVAVGTAVTYFVMKKTFVKVMDDIIEEQNNEIDRIFYEKEQEFVERLNGHFEEAEKDTLEEAEKDTLEEAEKDTLEEAEKDTLEEAEKDTIEEDTVEEETKEVTCDEYYDYDYNYEEEIDNGIYIPPYVINPEEMGDRPGYKLCYIDYYADGILTDENNDIITDQESIVGDGLQHFDEYLKDYVWVRNEFLKRDYEIAKNERTYKEIYEGEF